MELENKVILITGASSGIGKELAKKLAYKKAKLILVARREEKLKEVAESLGDLSQVITVRADVTQRAEVDQAVQSGIDRFGKLDILVNVAGQGYFGPIASMDMKAFDQVVKTNVYGLLNMVQASVPSLKKTQGMVVNISSRLSKRALPFLTAYAGSKSMVDALSDGMRLELKKYGIKVLNYCPPETETEFFEKTLHDPKMDPNAHPRKMAKPEDVAGRIVDAIVTEKREVVEGRFLQIMNFFAPKLLDKMFYKGMVLKLGGDD